MISSLVTPVGKFFAHNLLLNANNKSTEFNTDQLSDSLAPQNS